MHLSERTILVTGATSGIGRALAEALHERGNHVIITGRRQALLDEIVAKRPGMEGIALDVCDTASLRQLGDTVRERFPGLDMLVANAGVAVPETPLEDDRDTAAAQTMIDTNILGVLRVAKELLPVLRQQRQAALMTTTSDLAFVPRAVFPTYCASKAFVHSWLQSMRHQLRNDPVEVLELVPPYVQTSLNGTQQLTDPRAMPVDEFVAEVMELLETGDYPEGELLPERTREARFAERQGRYDAEFAAKNPA